MAEKKTKRVFAGYYERYDLVNIHEVIESIKELHDLVLD